MAVAALVAVELSPPPQLTDGYESSESGEIAFVFDLVLQTAVLNSAEYEIVAGIFELDAKSDWKSGDTLEVTAQQHPNGRSEVWFESAAECMQVDRSGTLSFNGEDRPIWATGTTKAGGPPRTVELPHDVDGTTD